VQLTVLTPKSTERGQTLPIWTFAILTALSLMFFSLNYANTLRWQIRAQNAADAAATMALSVQATQWNKITTILYAADVEEWRIRHLLQAMYDAAKLNGGCATQPTCLKIYQQLQPQYFKAVNRYTTDIQMLQAVSSIGSASQASDATTVIQRLKETCTNDPLPMADCAFTYHVIDYSHRTTTEQAGKDGLSYQLGGFSSPQDSTPVADWEPAQMEIATCATVQPLVNFGIFGQTSQPFTVIGRAAATNVTQTSEWFFPGITTNPNSKSLFQSAENYDTTDDTFASSSSPRDWYETNYPAIDYTALKYPIDNYYGNFVADDFEVMVCWWASVPTKPYTVNLPSQGTLCTQS
jgi:hypothetical protein